VADARLADRGHAEFARTLRWMVAQLQDGHGHVRDPRYQRGSLPWQLAWIEQAVVVTAANPETGLMPGDVLLSMDGKSASALLAETEAYVSGSPQWRRARALDQLADGAVASVVELSVRRGGETKVVRLQRQERSQVPRMHRPRLEKLAGGVWYVDLDRTPWDEIAQKLPEIAAAPGIIFDLRGYPKDNHEVIHHLLRENDRSDAWMLIPQIAYPDRERLVGYQKHGWAMEARQPHIQGKVAFITGPNAISYAESVMSFIEGYKLASIVGQPTAGTNGNINLFDRPGGFGVIWTGMKVVKHDGSQMHHIGIRPTVPAERTIEGVRQGRDELFEAALRLVSESS
jgi:C-terminal processing protease CtpA/Prc